jgi:Ca2+-binding RTX toxin-like protein
MRRRALLILASMMLGVLTLGGVALAKEITGTSGSDDLEGTNRADKIWGLQGPDHIAGEGGSDDLYGGRDEDEVRGADGRDYVDGGQDSDHLYGGRKNDWLKAVDGERDRVNCGSGDDDKAYVDEIDRVNNNCEDVKKDDDHEYGDHEYGDHKKD